MQRWEYCEITYLPNESSRGRRFKTQLAKLTLSGREVMNEVNNNADTANAGARLIAQLGEEGWEIVGAGNQDEYNHILYFERPK